METKFTPGPWSLFPVGGDCGTKEMLCPATADGLSILSLTEESDHVFAAVLKEADARLIAAAPDLLGFAKEWLERQGSDENYMTLKARAVIAKATGEQS